MVGVVPLVDWFLIEDSDLLGSAKWQLTEAERLSLNGGHPALRGANQQTPGSLGAAWFRAMPAGACGGVASRAVSGRRGAIRDGDSGVGLNTRAARSDAPVHAPAAFRRRGVFVAPQELEVA